MHAGRKEEGRDLKEDRPTSDSCLFVGKGHGFLHCAADVPGKTASHSPTAVTASISMWSNGVQPALYHGDYCRLLRCSTWQSRMLRLSRYFVRLCLNGHFGWVGWQGTHKRTYRIRSILHSEFVLHIIVSTAYNSTVFQVQMHRFYKK